MEKPNYYHLISVKILIVSDETLLLPVIFISLITSDWEGIAIYNSIINDLKIIGLVFIIIFFSGLVLSLCSTFFAVQKYIQLNENKLYN